MNRVEMNRVERIDGYLPLRDYALIGDGRTTALVGRDGSIDWLCLPRCDSPPWFDRILDADAGGRFELCPDEAFDAVRRYREGTNVLETTFTTASGSVRVTDALLRGDEPCLVRIVDGRAGSVSMRLRFEPRFDFGRSEPEQELRLRTWGTDDGPADDWFAIGEGDRATFTAGVGGGGASRNEVERELERTSAWWMDWSGRARYDGPWREQVVRSALVLKLLQYEPTGAIVAAPTTSLPERIGGELNWDYRFSWLRDGIYTMRALLSLGFEAEAEAFFRWQIEATRPDAPEVKPLYCVDGSAPAAERELDLPGYRSTRPVRIGNAATQQLQLDNYGHLLESASRLRGATGSLGTDAGALLASFADFVVAAWRRPDAGIWEVRDGQHDFVQSKAMCWTALDRAATLAAEGAIPDRGSTWRAAADAVRAWIEEDGWDERRGSYLPAPDLAGTADASLLSLALCAYSSAGEPRFASTVEAIRRDLSAGSPLLYRNTGSAEREGAFLTCSFWLVDVLGRAGRAEEGNELMSELVELANDVGLYAEEMDPDSGDLLGNFPQALVHLALVNAAVSLANGDES
ncbi:MAG: glycoside hydrolase family 15 protein [Gaiellaceae bacterium MAG52_C11]|nr:glycoside hydrolase family 15 protein [Candidatus Gaiellasilicea maunaloa]